MIRKGDFVVGPSNIPATVTSDPDAEECVIVSSGYSVQKYKTKCLVKLVEEKEFKSAWVVKNKEGRYLNFDFFITSEKELTEANFFSSKEDCERIINYYVNEKLTDGSNSFEIVEIELRIKG